MKTTPPPRPGLPWKGLAVVAALAGALATSHVAAGPATDSARTLVISEEAAQGDITFREPRRYAVVAEAPRSVKKLYTTGDVLIDPKNPRQQVIVHRLTSDSLVVREHPGAPPRRVTVGQPIPGAPGRTLAAIVPLARLCYRLKAVARVVHAEPVLVSLTGSTAILEREVEGDVPHLAPGPRTTPPPREESGRSPRTLDVELVAPAPVNQVDDGTFVLDGESLQPVLDTVRRMVPAKASGIIAAFPQQADLSIDMTSPLMDGTLHRRGFTVTNSKVAQAFGLRAGDTVLSLNGRAVNSPLNAWWAFQEILIKHRSVATLHLEVEREGARVVNKYQIR